MPPSRSQADDVDQFHHFIPQFFLRRFRFVQHVTRKYTSSSSSKVLDGKLDAPETRYDPDGRIHVYHLSTGQHSSDKGFKRIYGELNLYKDHRQHGNDPHHVERKFSPTEGKACAVLGDMHRMVARGQSTLRISHIDLQVFHKFLFLMQYRGSPSFISYWRYTHSHLREWISRRMHEKDLKDDFEFWLDCMQYVLETSHDSILAEAESIVQGGWDSEVVERMKKAEISPSVNWLALEYTTVAKDYFMSICEAADGTEFVLGSNSFGQTEEFTSGGERMHLIYVASPRLAIIFRKTSFNPGSPNAFSSANTTTLLDIHLQPPTDTYVFALTKLTPTQTQTVNNVVLYSNDNSGSLTFSSPTCALDTLRGYDASDYTLDSTRYTALLEKLPHIQIETIEFPTKRRKRAMKSAITKRNHN